MIILMTKRMTTVNMTARFSALKTSKSKSRMSKMTNKYLIIEKL